jgi:hypothetical protein
MDDMRNPYKKQIGATEIRREDHEQLIVKGKSIATVKCARSVRRTHRLAVDHVATTENSKEELWQRQKWE